MIRRTDPLIVEFYRALAEGNEPVLNNLKIPHSSVFYAREAYYQHSGEYISLTEMENAMRLEGLLPDS